jgi:hypothetical protein
MKTRNSPLSAGPCVLLMLFGLLLIRPALSEEGPGAGEKPGSARLGYTRVLKGSSPEYIALIVNEDGTGTYDGRELAGPSKPVSFKLTAATTERLYALAAALNNFQSIDLESHKKVANLGEKTFTYTRDGKETTATFNYTVRKEAQELSDTFERIATVEQHVQTLQFAIKYDPLSLAGDLLRVQIDLANKALADPELMVPTLEMIARNPRFMHLAQARAQDILQRVQNTNQ